MNFSENSPSCGSSTLSLLRCGLVYPHLLLRQLGEQRRVKAARKTLGEPQVRLESDLVGPQQRRAAPRAAEVTHGAQQFLQTAVVIDHIGCEHIVVVVGRMGEIPLQVLTPAEGSHLRGVAGPPLGVSQEVKGQIGQDVWEVSGCHPSPWKRVQVGIC